MKSLCACACVRVYVYVLSKCTWVEIHSFRSHIRDHFVLELKSTLKKSGIHSQKSGIRSQKIDSNHNFWVDSIQLQMKWSLIWLPKEWISTPLTGVNPGGMGGMYPPTFLGGGDGLYKHPPPHFLKIR